MKTKFKKIKFKHHFKMSKQNKNYNQNQVTNGSKIKKASGDNVK